MDYFTYLRTTYTGTHKDDDDNNDDDEDDDDYDNNDDDEDDDDVHDYDNDADHDDNYDGIDGDDYISTDDDDCKIVRLVIRLTLNYVFISELKKLCRHEEVTIKNSVVYVNSLFDV